MSPPRKERAFFLSRWDRYLGMTAPMTQVPVPTATVPTATVRI